MTIVLEKAEKPCIFFTVPILLDGVALQIKIAHPDLDIICQTVANLYYLVLMMLATCLFFP